MLGPRAAQMRAAKAWGLKPSDLGICTPADDLTYIIAWERTEARMTAWEHQEAEREAKRGTKNRA